jgi:hypothetical protein
MIPTTRPLLGPNHFATIVLATIEVTPCPKKRIPRNPNVATIKAIATSPEGIRDAIACVIRGEKASIRREQTNPSAAIVAVGLAPRLSRKIPAWGINKLLDSVPTM